MKEQNSQCRRSYIAELQPEPGQSEDETMRALRHILKRLGRTYHIRVVRISPASSASSEGDPEPSRP